MLSPSGLDVTGFSALQFRASVNFEDPRNPLGVPQDLSVVLSDVRGHTCAVQVSQSSNALFFPPGGQFGADVVVPPKPVPKVFLNTARIPIPAFACGGGFNPTRVQSVQLQFDRTASGALLISDLAFAR